MIYQLDDLGLLGLFGPKARDLLQGQITCDITEVTPEQSCLAALCNPQGRMLSFFRVFWHNEGYLLQMPRELIPTTLLALKKYLPFYQLTALDVSNRYFSYGKQEGRGFEIRLSQEKLAASLDTEEWHGIEIESGIPRIYPETSGIFLPHELRLPSLGAVSFSKGCYTGQEIIARMQYRGKVKTQLTYCQLQTDNLIKRAQDLFSPEKVIGTIVDYSKMGYNNYLLLVVTHDPEKTFLNAECTLKLDLQACPNN